MPTIVNAPGFRERLVSVNGIGINVATAGEGPPVLLLHGWPHTWRVWGPLMALLARDRLVVAPDLRGLGGSSRTADGYDLHTLSDDLAALLDALQVGPVLVVGLDLGAAVAWMLAMRHPGTVRRLAVMEGLIGDLPGAEAFLAAGPPWWFGFHGTPDLAETVLIGHEGEYLDWFYRSGTKDGRGIAQAERDAFVSAYAGRESLRCGFAHYRSFKTNAEQVRVAVAQQRPSVPTLAVIGGTVGDAVHKQLEPITDDLARHEIADCGHLIPLEQPEALRGALLAFDAA